MKPIAQFDKIDGIKGPDPVGINGASFWRGDDTGLQYSYVDTDVKNGVTYYYAVVSYDMGDPNFGTTGLQPSECTKIITVDYAGNVQFVDINCAVVTPNAPVAGYVPPQILGDTKKVTDGVGTGSLQFHVFDPRIIEDGTNYEILFNSTNDYPLYKTLGYQVIKTKGNDVDTILTVDSSYIGADRVSPPFDGLAITVLNDTTVTIIDSLTGWLIGNSNLVMQVFPDQTPVRGVPWPADYEITFYDGPADTCYISSPPLYRRFPVNFKVWNKTEQKYSKIAVQDRDGSQSLTIGDVIQIIEFKDRIVSPVNIRFAWNITYNSPFDPNETPVYPKEGDKFVITTRKPFKKNDKFIVTTKASIIDNSLAKSQLSKIDVVPNPYLGAAAWEKRNLHTTGRGERKIDFINLPNKCTIRIYTLSGQLIKTIHKDSGYLDGTVSWNLITDDGMEAAYGVYIYHVEAPGIGEHIGKFALIK